MSLAGKWFLHFAKDHIHLGQVVEQISPDVVLVKFDEHEVAEIKPMALINVSLLLTKMDKDGCPSQGSEFFDSYADLSEFLQQVRQSDDDQPAKTIQLPN